jgi:hypothetical protein
MNGGQASRKSSGSRGSTLSIQPRPTGQNGDRAARSPIKLPVSRKIITQPIYGQFAVFMAAGSLFCPKMQGCGRFQGAIGTLLNFKKLPTVGEKPKCNSIFAATPANLCFENPC